MRASLSVATLLLVAVLPKTPLRAQTTPDRYRDELQPLLEKFIQEHELPGLAIGVIEDNRVVYARGFGVQHLNRKNDAVTPRSLFHMASITKPFVATSIMQLVEQGKIDLDSPVLKYLAYFRIADERYKTITVRQMVTHTSGMPDVENYEWDNPQYDGGALERYVRGLTGFKLLFEPGTSFRYSNMAFEVLGDLIAKVSGESFEAYVQRHILTPLGMKDSTLLVKQADQKLMTWGHELDGDGRPFPSKVCPYNRMHSPSSNLHSSVVDMARWAIANMRRGELDGRRILKESTYDVMWKPARAIGPPGGTTRNAVGISWFLSEHRGHASVGHGGGDTGYRTDIAMLPERKIAVVWMTNCDWGGNRAITSAALDVALGLKPAAIVMKRRVR